jgi:hypothetical protein
VATQSDLENSILLMLYEESGGASRRLKANEIAARFQPREGVARVAAGLSYLQSRHLVSGSFDNFTASGFAITRDGLLWVQDNFEQRDDGPNSEFRITSSEADDDGGEIPASDRVVRLDHNQPDYQEVRSELANLREAVRTANDLEIEPAERNRVLASLDSAQTLWAAAQLKVVQVKVGIVMVVEEARHVISSTSKAVVGALIVDMIKAFIKTHTGIDLDRI